MALSKSPEFFDLFETNGMFSLSKETQHYITCLNESCGAVMWLCVT